MLEDIIAAVVVSLFVALPVLFLIIGGFEVVSVVTLGNKKKNLRQQILGK